MQSSRWVDKFFDHKNSCYNANINNEQRKIKIKKIHPGVGGRTHKYS